MTRAEAIELVLSHGQAIDNEWPGQEAAKEAHEALIVLGVDYEELP